MGGGRFWELIFNFTLLVAPENTEIDYFSHYYRLRDIAHICFFLSFHF